MAAKHDLSVDGDLVRALAALLDETGLSEIEYAVGDKRIRVARGTVAASAPAAPVVIAAPAPAPAIAAAEPQGAVKAPMVGICHLSPQPGAPPFVQAGDQVREGQTLFIIEAMKVMNQIPAPRAGRIAQILVTNGAPVEFGQVLAVIE
ncbi:MAG TPA: acetyl-CoA carboxylase biotin carboxyl carrier protein subunit [Stellaceae bacterium]|nr:acetyl-CoA carboxylase biotin carboxyl carrier protein subunit [Stellaceae bacterium]